MDRGRIDRQKLKAEAFLSHPREMSRRASRKETHLVPSFFDTGDGGNLKLERRSI